MRHWIGGVTEGEGAALDETVSVRSILLKVMDSAANPGGRLLPFYMIDPKTANIHVFMIVHKIATQTLK